MREEQIKKELTVEERLSIRDAQYEYLVLMEQYRSTTQQLNELTNRINELAAQTQQRQMVLEQKYEGKLDLVTLALQ